MKKFLLTAILGTACVAGAHAELEGDGYYRIQNYVTERYAYVTDNKGKIDFGATKVDAGAIQLWKGFDRAVSDPSTVIYIEHQSGYKYNLYAQGESLYNIFDQYLSVIETPVKPGQTWDGTYFAYGTYSGAASYLCDGEASDLDRGLMTNTKVGDYRKWYIKPLSTDGDQYFGVKTEYKANGKNYTTMYAGFPMKGHSNGMKAYTISTVGHGMAVLSEVKGVIPKGTPVIWECNNETPSSNRVEIGGEGSAVSNNQLVGVYFCNHEYRHENFVKYDANTMRLLGLMDDGSLGFVTATVEDIPANKAYLKVPAGSPAKIKVVTQAEYDAYIASLPTSIAVNPATAALHVGESTTLSVSYLPEGSKAVGVNWTSSNPTIVTVDASGKVTAVANGTATVTATTAEGTPLTASCSVTVTTLPTSISVSPSGAAMNVGEERALEVTFAPQGCETYPISWSSSAPEVASVTEAGVVKALSNGNAVITATTTGGVSLTATCEVTVSTMPTSISITPESAELHKGEKMSLGITYYPEESVHLGIVWWSENENVAKVDASGVVTAVGNGTAVIKAVPDGLTITAEATVTVTTLAEKITLDPRNYTALPGTVFSIEATVLPEDASDKNVTWTTDNEEVATVDSNGNVTVTGIGAANITCTAADGSDVSAVCQVSGVTGIDQILADGQTADVYTVSGIMVKRGATADDVRSLPSGIYIINGSSVVIK